jgi:hypothetical protein
MGLLACHNMCVCVKQNGFWVPGYRFMGYRFMGYGLWVMVVMGYGCYGSWVMGYGCYGLWVMVVVVMGYGL